MNAELLVGLMVGIMVVYIAVLYVLFVTMGDK